MTTTSYQTACVKCSKTRGLYKCKGCLQDFCFDHLAKHRDELKEQLDDSTHQYNEFIAEIDDLKVEPKKHNLMQKIDEWELASIEKIKDVANEVRRELSPCIIKHVNNLDIKLKQLTEQLAEYSREDDFAEPDIETLKEKLESLKENLKNPSHFTIDYKSTAFIHEIHCLATGLLQRFSFYED